MKFMQITLIILVQLITIRKPVTIAPEEILRVGLSLW